MSDLYAIVSGSGAPDAAPVLTRTWQAIAHALDDAPAGYVNRRALARRLARELHVNRRLVGELILAGWLAGRIDVAGQRMRWAPPSPPAGRRHPTIERNDHP